jgi:hypothetical protein
MSWVKLDDGFWSDPRVDGLSLQAVGVFARSLSYCGQHLTDGHITTAAAKYLSRGSQKIVKELVEAGFWVANGAGYAVPNFLDFNPSREHVEDERRKAAERMRDVRANTKRTGRRRS